MHEIGIDYAEIVAVIHGVDQLLAHFHKRGGAAGRQIEPAEQFLPARLGGQMHVGGGLVVRRRLPGRDRFLQRGAIGAEALRQSFEEGDARADGELGVAGEDFARERHAGGLAASGKELLAQRDQIFRSCGGVRTAWPRPLDAGRGRGRRCSAAVRQRRRCSLA